MTNNQRLKKQTIEQDPWILELAEEDFKIIMINVFMKYTKSWKKEMKGWKVSSNNWNLSKSN